MSNTLLAVWTVAGVATVTVLYAIWAGQTIAVRYILAMVFAAVGAVLATLFLASPAASFATAQFSFESPDEAETIHALAWMGTNVAGLIVGWSLGWLLSGSLVRRRQL